MTPVSASLSTLEQFLKLATTRQEAIASNMANVDTPGYRTRDLNFQAEMHKAMESGSSSLTNSDSPFTQHAAIKQVKGLMERPDGNNVNLDREGMLMSETQLQYQMGVQLIKRQFHSIMSAISGGN
jgi:flagellar basal-body rod protein FlgB